MSGTTFTAETRDPRDFPNWDFPTVEIEYEPHTQSVWMHYKEQATPHYSMQTLTDMVVVGESLRDLFASDVLREFPIRYFVMASRKPGVFQLGGDLAMFAKCIRTQEKAFLRLYAHTCVDVGHALVTAFGLPIVTLSVVAGRALGGGFEAAMAEDYVLAEENALLGVPEVAFNTFPGMGAVSFLNRRLGTAGTDELITTGEVYSGRKMFDLGVVDILSADGRARETALEWMDQGEERYSRRLNMAALRRHVFPVTFEELLKIVDVWVDCSCGITRFDIRHMERIAAAQQQKFA